MTAKIRSLTAQGLQCTPVEIEVDVAQGLPSFIIVGLPDAAVSEARDRVRSAIKNSGFQFPRTRVTVNLAPAHTKKIGSLYDLPIALGILLASDQLQQVPAWFIVGELALDGRTHAVAGALPLIHGAASVYKRPIIVPSANSAEASLIDSDEIYTADTLRDVVEAFSGDGATLCAVQAGTPQKNNRQPLVDMADIIGQYSAKRAVEIAAAGGHNILFSGPPGVGKSMLAKAVPGILPPLNREEVVEVSMLHSVSSREQNAVVTTRPFRAPHHTTSAVALLGGGARLEPGEISLAHKGVLFLDELPEFRRDVIESMRQPLEDGSVTIRRAHGVVEYPADCQFIAAVNPCPCGYYGVREQYPDIQKDCTCTLAQVQRYQQKISGPLLDRIHMSIPVSYMSPAEMTELREHTQRELSSEIQKRVSAARDVQHRRQACLNSSLSAKHLRKQVQLDTQSHKLLEKAMQMRGLSLRGYAAVLAVAQTIADVVGEKHVSHTAVAEALNYVMPLGSE